MARRAAYGAGHEVVVVHPERDDPRPCRLAFDRQGVALLAAPAHRGAPPATLARIRWRCIEGFSADATATDPQGRTVQALSLVTDDGTLTLLCPAPVVGAAVADLAAWAPHWRAARGSRTSRVCAAVAAAWARAREVLVCAALAVASFGRRWTAAAHRVPRPARDPVRRALRPAAPLGRLASRNPLSVGIVSVSLLSWAAVMAAGPPSLPVLPSVPASAATPGVDATGMAKLVSMAEWTHASSAAHLVPATAAPPPAPPSVADAPALSAHEVLGFVPYWDLGSATSIDVGGFTTLAYFAVGANPTGTLADAGTGWDGYESQDFADLVARAHAAGTRVVLTVNEFTQTALNTLSHTPADQTVLADAIVAAVAAKNLDGVNIDFEGAGSGDQAGLTQLVGTVADVLKAANPHYQLTMDTYASSAGDTTSFYDVPALSPEVDAFFVMSYGFNMSSPPDAASPITSTEFSYRTTVNQYLSVVPAAKVILGTAYFGYTFPTTNGTMAAQALTTGTAVTYAQVLASGHPIYWDDVTDTAWTSYEVGTQWYETYFQDPASVYMIAQLASTNGLDGVGAWALGMDGAGSQAMTDALDGNAPVERAGPAGPAHTSQSVGTPMVAPPTPGTDPVTLLPGGRPVTVVGTATTTTTSPPATTTTTSPAPTSTTTTTTSPPPTPPTTTTTTTSPPPTTTTTTTAPAPPRSRGEVDGVSVTLTAEPTSALPSGTGTKVGTLTGFTSTDPSKACLAAAGTALEVLAYSGSADDWVLARQPTDCVTATWTVPAADLPAAPPGTTTSTTPDATGSSVPTSTGTATTTAGSTATAGGTDPSGTAAPDASSDATASTALSSAVDPSTALSDGAATAGSLRWAAGGVAVAFTVQPAGARPAGAGTEVATLTPMAFASTDPAAACPVPAGTALDVLSYAGSTDDWVVAPRSADCPTVSWRFPAADLAFLTRAAAPGASSGSAG